VCSHGRGIAHGQAVCRASALQARPKQPLTNRRQRPILRHWFRILVILERIISAHALSSVRPLPEALCSCALLSAPSLLVRPHVPVSHPSTHFPRVPNMPSALRSRRLPRFDHSPFGRRRHPQTKSGSECVDSSITGAWDVPRGPCRYGKPTASHARWPTRSERIEHRASPQPLGRESGPVVSGCLGP